MPRIAKGDPTPSDVHIDQPLTNMSIAYMQTAGSFVATRMHPVITVPKQTNKYFTFNKADFFRDEAKKRAPGTESVGGGYRISTDSYTCDVWALHKDIDRQTMSNYDNPLDPRRNATNWLTQQMLIRMEVQYATDFFTGSVWATNKSNAFVWNDAASDPRADISTAKRTIKVNTGMSANKLALGYDVFEALKRHPNVRDQFKYVSSASITREMIAQMFELEEVLVLEAVKATSLEGAATETFDFISGSRNALLAYVPSAPAIEMPAAGYTFMWNSPDGPTEGLGATGVSTWYSDDRKSWRVEIESAFDNKVTGSDLGYFWTNAVDAVS